jgi:hypothetical protein
VIGLTLVLELVQPDTQKDNDESPTDNSTSEKNIERALCHHEESRKVSFSNRNIRSEYRQLNKWANQLENIANPGDFKARKLTKNTNILFRQ